MNREQKTYHPDRLIISGKFLPAALLSVLFMLILFAGEVFSQLDIVSPKDSSIVSSNRIAVIVRGTPGSIVELSINSMQVKRDTVRIDGLLDFLNIEVPQGDVTVEVKQAGKNGAVSPSKNKKIHVLGPPALLTMTLEKNTLPADGISKLSGSVKIFDQWNYQIQNGINVTVSVDSGTIVTHDIDPQKRGVQISLVNGEAAFEYVSAKTSGSAVIKSSVNFIEAATEVELTTPFEKFALVGLATGTGQSAESFGDISSVQSKNSYPDGLKTDGRIALYARGTVFSDYRLTASFDSDRRERSRFYRDLDPDFLYSIYGDNSMLYYDAQTTRQLYARLERNKSYLMIGDYNSDLTKQEFTLYNRTLYGVKAEHQSGNLNITGFGSLTDKKVVQKEIRGTGLSGLYNLGALNITQGSEKVRIETRDRFHSEVLLKQLDQYRFSDYEIDYAQGTIFFKQPVSAIDGDGNPVYIVASYEAYDGSDKSYLGGGRVEYSPFDQLTVGVNGVVEEQQPKNYMLYGCDLKVNIGDLFTLNGEVGQSNHFTGNGLAYKVETGITPIQEFGLKGYYRNVDKGFFNITQSGSGRELGSKKYGASGTGHITSTTKLTGDYYNSLQQSQSGEVKINSLSGSVEQSFFSDFSTALKVEDIKYDGPGRDTSSARLKTHSVLGTGRLSYTLSQRLSVAVQHDRNFGTEQDVTKPNATMLNAEYRVIDPVSLQAQQKFYEKGGSLSSFGVTSTPLDGTTLYGKYEIGNAIGQYRNMLSIGLKNQLKLGWDLAANFGCERAKSLEQRLGETPTDDHTAVSAGLEYLPTTPVKATAKAEYGDNNLAKKYNYFLGFDFRLNNDLSLIAKNLLSFDNAKKSDGYQNRYHGILGFAYRPVETNWLNLIGKVEMKSDNNHYLTPFVDTRASILSAHAFVEPVERVELGLKYAYKYGVDKSDNFSFASHTQFYLANLRYNLSRKFDVGGEFRLLHQTEAGDYLFGYHAEVGYIMIDNFRIGAGYNFKGFGEKDLVDYSLWSKGPFVRMSMKFDEGFFGL